MKIHGQQPIQPRSLKYKVVRPAASEGEEDVSYEFVVSPVLNTNEVDALLSPPEPPKTVHVKTGKTTYNTNDQNYLIALNEYEMRHTCGVFLRALKNTPGLVWDQVDLDDPDTWHFMWEELKAFMTDPEIVELVKMIQKVMNPGADTMKEAFDVFTQDTPGA